MKQCACVCVLNVDTRQDYIACTASLLVEAYDTYNTFAAPVKINEDTSKSKLVWEINTTHNRQKAILLKKLIPRQPGQMHMLQLHPNASPP